MSDENARLAPCPICGKLPIQQFRPCLLQALPRRGSQSLVQGRLCAPVTENDDEDGDQPRDEPTERS